MKRALCLTIIAVLAFLLGVWVGAFTRQCILLSPSHPDTIARGQSSVTCYTKVLGKRLKWEVSTDTLKSSPPWTNQAAQPPPLSIEQVIAISRPEVGKYFPDADAWRIEEVVLQTLGQEDRWYYVAQWRRPGAVGDSLGIPVLMSGATVPLVPDLGEEQK